MRNVLIALALSLSVSISAFAAAVGDTYVLPVAGHLTGAGGQTWVTDVTLHNAGDSQLVVDLAGVGRDGAVVDLNASTVTVGPRGSVTLRDVVRGGAGALIVAGSGPFTLTSRVFSDGARGSFGQTVSAISEFLGADSADAFLPGIVATSRYRTNIGFFAVAESTDLQLDISVVDAAGTVLGSKTFRVPAGQMSQLQVSSREIASAAFDVAAARVHITGDGLASAYASVVDTTSGDASFIPADVAFGSNSAALLRQRTALRQRIGGAATH